jgi:hypothetical protein
MVLTLRKVMRSLSSANGLYLPFLHYQCELNKWLLTLRKVMRSLSSGNSLYLSFLHYQCELYIETQMVCVEVM